MHCLYGSAAQGTNGKAKVWTTSLEDQSSTWNKNLPFSFFLLAGKNQSSNGKYKCRLKTVVVLFGEMGVEVLDVSNANTVLQLISERDKYHCSVAFNLAQEKKTKTSESDILSHQEKVNWRCHGSGWDTGAWYLQHQLKSACAWVLSALKNLALQHLFP